MIGKEKFVQIQSWFDDEVSIDIANIVSEKVDSFFKAGFRSGFNTAVNIVEEQGYNEAKNISDDYTNCG